MQSNVRDRDEEKNFVSDMCQFAVMNIMSFGS